MIRLPRTLRLDASDPLVFGHAAAPGEWAVPGGFAFADDDLAALTGKRQQAFRAGFLGLGSFGWSTLVEVAAATAAERDAAVAALAAHFWSMLGAPDEAAAVAAAKDEIAFAETLCDHPLGTLLALTRSRDGDAVRERFRTLHRRDATLPVFALVPDDDAAPEPVDLRALPR